VLGLRIVEVPATKTLITVGLMVSRLANHPRLQPSLLYAPNAASLQNLVKSVAAVAVVLGPETAEALLTPSFITRGTRASRPAKHWRSPSQPSTDCQMWLNSETT